MSSGGDSAHVWDRRRFLGVLGAGALAPAALSACGTDRAPGRTRAAAKKDRGTITIGYVAWDEDIAVTELWKQLLESKGYRVEAVQKDAVPDLFRGVASGRFDVFMDAWLPSTHTEQWAQYGGSMVDLGPWYEPGDLGLAVPDYVEEVESLVDLPEHAGLFDGTIVGIEPTAGLTRTVDKSVIPEYGLTGKYRQKAKDTGTMLQALDSAYAERRPVLVGMWRPHWAFSKYDIRYLDDPADAFGDPDKIHTVVSRKFHGRGDNEALEWLQNFRVTPDQLQGLEAAIQEAGGADHKSATVETWIGDNESLVKQWLPI
ncbi:glycine/betaine ABC transporter substrate-binding protein [Streptomyces triticagri]|uniref:Glycine/betaine ABC transporter substrate-binding protein n=1 Tax=Streptomyces triticagri TaxID=2293568 RepID=A0A372LY44_9ACTN|nr:glycine betaine ABC transporter substrate-binding protein [Streptomyces triticagri]RFU83469.1 glycine/betaine ABC transporter substrate-binding protein [Streptomyces triticagri]